MHMDTQTRIATNTHMYTLIIHALHLIVLVCGSYIMLFFNFIGAGDVVAAALPDLKCLQKVSVWEMNPVAVLQTVDLCGKLQEVSVVDPKHCEVGMRCAYRWM